VPKKWNDDSSFHSFRANYNNERVGKVISGVIGCHDSHSSTTTHRGGSLRAFLFSSANVEPVTTKEVYFNMALPKHTFDDIDGLVTQRGQARWEGNYTLADKLKQDMFQIELPTGLELVLEDVPRSQGGGSLWKVVHKSPDEQALQEQSRSSSSSSSSVLSVLQLAHSALGLAVTCSKKMEDFDQKQSRLTPLVEQARSSLLAWKQVQEQLLDELRVSNNSDTSQCSEEEFVGGGGGDHDTDQRSQWSFVEATLRGRKAADAAFWFALAGVTDQELFDLLALVCTKELHRFGHKTTCRAKDILQMMDRFAAAGVQSGEHPALEDIAQRCLQMKEYPETSIDYSSTIESNLLDLHSDQSLLMLWKFSARQKKQQSFLESAQKHWENDHHQQQQQQQQMTTTESLQTDSNEEDVTKIASQHHYLHVKKKRSSQGRIVWSERFDDPTKPLVIDVGCGMGISLLGLASLGNNVSDSSNNNFVNLVSEKFHDCNMLGVDLSGLAVGYAQGIAKRWGLSHRLQFEVTTAESLLEQVRASYPGPVFLCLVQFPTPYRLPVRAQALEDSGLQDEEAAATASLLLSSSGNSQLPKSALEGFMVSPALLDLIQQVLLKDSTLKSKDDDYVDPKFLLLQSNCEDVAVWMQQTAVETVGYQAISMAYPVEEESTQADGSSTNGIHSSNCSEWLPKRTQNWIEMGGDRAIGNFWSSRSLLPREGSTETEVACRTNKTPIHRCVLSPRQGQEHS